MWLLVIVGGIGTFMTLVFLRVLPPPGAKTVIKFNGDIVRVTRGALSANAKQDVAGIAMETGITRGFIAILPGGRTIFSRTIPPEIQQYFRNVLANQ